MAFAFVGFCVRRVTHLLSFARSFCSFLQLTDAAFAILHGLLIFFAIVALSLVSGFSNRVCFSVVSGCFFERVSPSLPLRPKLALTRGLEGSELAFRRLKSARKVRAKSFGP